MPRMNEYVKSLVWAEYIIDKQLDYQPMVKLIEQLDEPLRTQMRDEYLFATVHAAELGIAAGYAAGMNPQRIMQSQAEL